MWRKTNSKPNQLSTHWSILLDDGRNLEVTSVGLKKPNVQENSQDPQEGMPDPRRTERLIRFIVYWIALGIFLDISIYYARFNRTNTNHDEFHAALMILSFLSALGMDIWFVVRQFGDLFKGNMEIDVYFYLICASNILALPQLGTLEVIQFTET